MNTADRYTCGRFVFCLDENGQQTHDYKSLADSITTLPTLRSNIVDLVQSVEDSCETNIPDFVHKVRNKYRKYNIR